MSSELATVDLSTGTFWPEKYHGPAQREPFVRRVGADIGGDTYPIPSGAGAPDWAPERFTISFEESWLYELYEERILEGNNDLIGCVAAASKSAGSGIGKTMLLVQLARALDNTARGYVAQDKATLSASAFARELMNNPDRVEDQSAVTFEEATGTLADQGADARRSMAGAVMDVTKALATLRYRQCVALLVAQNISWLDKRLRDVLDFLILIQEPGRAIVFHPYGNDFSRQQFNERKFELRWSPLPYDGANDADYQHLESMKRDSTKKQMEEQSIELSRDQKVLVGARLRQRGVRLVDTADALGMSEGWVSENCSGVDPDEVAAGL